MNISAAKTYIELLVLSRSIANGKKMYEFQKRCLDGIYICLRGDYIQDPETSKMMGSRPFEKFDKSGDSGIIYINKQLGKKFGKHCSDWGLDPSNSKDRDNIKTIINDIVSSPDEIRIGK